MLKENATCFAYRARAPYRDQQWNSSNAEVGKEDLKKKFWSRFRPSRALWTSAVGALFVLVVVAVAQHASHEIQHCPLYFRAPTSVHQQSCRSPGLVTSSLDDSNPAVCNQALSARSPYSRPAPVLANPPSGTLLRKAAAHIPHPSAHPFNVMGLFSKTKAPPPPPPVAVAPPPPSMQEVIFKMRFTSKTIGRQATKSQKQIALEEHKAKDAMAKNNMDGARIHAENAIRVKNEALGYLKLQSQLEAVAAKLQAQQVRAQVTESMTAVVSNLDQALGTMDVTQISYTMEKFIEQSENLDLQTKYMDGAIGESTSSSMPQGQVNGLLQRIADENDLDVKDRIQGYHAPIGQPQYSTGSQLPTGNGDLEARLAALQGGPRP